MSKMKKNISAKMFLLFLGSNLLQIHEKDYQEPYIRPVSIQ